MEAWKEKGGVWAVKWGVAVSVDEGRRSGVERLRCNLKNYARPTYPIRPRHHFRIFLLEMRIFLL